MRVRGIEIVRSGQFRGQGLGFRAWGLGCRAWGSGIRVEGPGFRAFRVLSRGVSWRCARTGTRGFEHDFSIFMSFRVSALGL